MLLCYEKWDRDYFSFTFNNSCTAFLHTPVWTELCSQTKLCWSNEQKLRKKLAPGNPSPPLDLTPSTSLEVNISVPPPPALPSLHQIEVEVPEAAQEQSNHISVEAVPAVPMQMSVLPPCISREQLAATKIQTAFRGYLVI